MKVFNLGQLRTDEENERILKEKIQTLEFDIFLEDWDNLSPENRQKGIKYLNDMMHLNLKIIK